MVMYDIAYKIHLKRGVCMKKWIAGAVIVLILLIIADKFILKDNNHEIEEIEKYEKLENASELPFGLNEGKRAPDFELVDLNGKTVKLSDYLGKPVLLNFWATWCPPCKDEMPHMEKLYKKYEKDGFAILAVNVTTSEKDPTHVGQFVDEYKLTFPIPLDEKGAVFHDYAIIGYPTSFFIDSEGVIRRKVMGPVKEDELEKEILKLL